MAEDPEKYPIAVDANRTNSVEFTGTTEGPRSLLELGNGDLVLGADGDLLISNPTEYAAQAGSFVMKTSFDSAEYYSFLGTRLRRFIGRLLNNDTISDLEDTIREDLETNRVPFDEEALEVLPLDEHIIVISLVILSPSQDPIRIVYKFDILSGAIEDIGGAQV